MRSSWVVPALLALAAGSAEAQRPRTILFIGNSFTFGSGSAVRYWQASTVTDLNDEGTGGVPALFESFTEQMGLPWDVYLETRGGSAFSFHLQEKRAEITSRPWDVVVAHSYSTLDRDAPNDPTDLLARGRELSEVLHGRSPSVELYVTATWSRPTGVDPALGRGECSGYELGMSAGQVEALQQVAHDELVASGVTLSVPAGWEAPARGGACRG